MEIDVGRVIGDKYRLVKLLGRGSMGEVWAAHHQTLDEKVALKLLTQPPPGEEALESPEAANARFLFEAQLAARLSRKTRHIVRVTDHGEQNGLPYLVMELLEGETLEAVLVREKRLDLLRVSDIVGQIARALGQAHGEGVAHRDLKPANVFLTHDEDGKLVTKLLDFGIARAIHAHRRPPGALSTAQGTVFGTPSYMSPEQARGSRRLDHRCDLWALATIAYEGATGELPLEGLDADELLKNLCAGKLVPIGERDPQLAARLDPFFRRAFADDVTQRFQSAGELAREFAHAVGGAVGEVSVPSLPEGEPEIDAEVPGVPRRGRALVAVAAAIVAVGVIGLAWHALARSPEPTASPVASAPTVSAVLVALPPIPSVATDPGSATPVVAVSSLPRAGAVPTSVRPPPAVVPAVIPTLSGPVVAAPPVPTPAPTPSPAPTRKDKSEVF
jgi:eukaryotic-like serine/threonine-protein kinase